MSSHDNSISARHTVSGSLYSVASSSVTIFLGFIRAVLMTRLLSEGDFGVATLALFYLSLVVQLRTAGIDNALIHRKDADQKVLATYFTLQLGLNLGTTVLLVLLALFIGRFYPEDMRLLGPVLLAFTGLSIVRGLNAAQVTVLSKALAFRTLAITDVLSSVTMTIVGPSMAWMGYGVWSIVGEQLSGALMRFITVWIFYRAWRPRLGWDKEAARWFWNYGKKMWMGTNLSFLLARFDDWWIGSFLGSNPLGFYSRAYEFAGYPRRVVANPLLSVFFPTFARLQDDRERLSKAFFRMMSLMVRAGALFSLIFILTAPEFIKLLLSENWLPMLVTFQLMIIYTLLDPITVAVNNLLAATGHPDIITRVRAIQFVIFLPAVILLGVSLGIEGVAIAADLMVFTGAILLLRQTRRIVDYSWRQLWFWPMIIMLVTGGIILALGSVWASLPLWMAFTAKVVVILILFLGTLWLVERKQLMVGWQMIWGLVQPRLKSIARE